MMVNSTTPSGASAPVETRYFYHQNAQYNVVALTDASGAVVERYSYDPYGRTTFHNADGTVKSDQSSSVGNPYLYTGRRYDAESGLYYYRARYYDAWLGRFLSRDPGDYLMGDENLYRYCGDGPTNALDPTGKVKINGWDLCGKNESEIQKFIYDSTGKIEKAEVGVSGSFTIEIEFSSAGVDCDKLKCFKKLLSAGLRRADANLAADHFEHWTDGSGASLPIEASVFKDSREYKWLKEELAEKCKAGGGQAGSSAVVGHGNLFPLLGAYSYQWSIGKKDSNGCCSAKFKVDDKYDFHSGKKAVFSTEKSVKNPLTGGNVNVTVMISVPDDVLTKLQECVGAKDFDRITEWSDTVCPCATSKQSAPAGASSR